MADELALVRNVCGKFQTGEHVELGLGDDAAVVRLTSDPRSRVVVSADLLTDGVDFLLHRMDPRRIGRKALGVNLSDLAAMAAEPLGCVISVALPRAPRFPDVPLLGRSEPPAPLRDVSLLMDRLGDGFLDMTRDVPCTILGGDTNLWDGALVVAITVLGRLPEHRKPLTRSGARPGDGIYVTGTLGGSILRRQFTFTPRIREAGLLADRFPLSAGMDLSDGLALDLHRLVTASGCGAALDLEAIPVSDDARELSRLDCRSTELYDWVPTEFATRSPLQHALGDGEDFEILFTCPERVDCPELVDCPGVPVTRIGTITDSPPGTVTDQSGRPIPLLGFEH